MKPRRLSLVALLFAALLAYAPAGAQEDTRREAGDLARRLLGYSGETPIPPPSPLYEVGDRAEFWVSKAGQDQPSRVGATLAAVGQTVYLWVEEGLEANPQALTATARQLDNLFLLVSLRQNFGGLALVPQNIDQALLADRARLPDADGDPTFYVLFARDLFTGRSVIYNPANTSPAPWVAGGWSNEHDMLLVNTSATPGLALDDPQYLSLLIRQFYALVAYYTRPGQAEWLREAGAWQTIFQIENRSFTAQDAQAYFAAAPAVGLNNPFAAEGITAGQLFINYVRQRLGDDLYGLMMTQEGGGLAPLERALEITPLTDLVTGARLTAADIYADFVMANGINQPIGDGRYFYPRLEAMAELFAAPQQAISLDEPRAIDTGAAQFGSQYLTFITEEPTRVLLSFDGVPQAVRLPSLPGDPTNRFYYAESVPNQDIWMERTLDLTTVSRATLTFDVWHRLNEAWNWGYVTVSADEGQTWQVLPATTTAAANPYALGYGPGFTGSSNTEPARPFPFLGVGLAADGLTLNSIREDSPLVGTDVRVGDVIAGYDGQPWPGTPNILQFLSNFRPGETVNLYMQRGDEFYEVEVTLAAHPTRRFVPPPIWVAQEADLTPYAGKVIRLRFELVNADIYRDEGLAVDNIAVPEIDYRDDAESGVRGWSVNGWQQIDNRVPQRYLLQYAILNPQAPALSRVQRLIGPSDPATSGAWTVGLEAGDIMVVAVSPISPEAGAPATFRLATAPSDGGSSA